MYYRNCSNISRTFFGVKFLPGEVKFVPGYINSNSFVRVKSSDARKELREDKKQPKQRKSKKKAPEIVEESKENIVDENIDVDLSIIDSDDSIEITNI